MRTSAYDTFKVGDVTVEIHHDDHAEAPGCSYDESMMLVAWGRDFHNEVLRYDCLSDFADFINPHNLDEYDYPEAVAADEPTVEPEAEDERWIAVYTEAAGELEQIALQADGPHVYSDDLALSAAEKDLETRRQVWQLWQEYRKAHQEYACFVVYVNNYGGGHVRLSLGDVYDGDNKDARGREREPEAMIRIKRSEFTHGTPQSIAQAIVDEWNQWLEGDVWGYVLTREDTDEELDSCWGYYGIDDCKEAATDQAKWYDQHMIKQLKLPFPEGQEAANG